MFVISKQRCRELRLVGTIIGITLVLHIGLSDAAASKTTTVYVPLDTEVLLPQQGETILDHASLERNLLATFQQAFNGQVRKVKYGVALHLGMPEFDIDEVVQDGEMSDFMAKGLQTILWLAFEEFVGEKQGVRVQRMPTAAPARGRILSGELDGADNSSSSAGSMVATVFPDDGRLVVADSMLDTSSEFQGMVADALEAAAHKKLHDQDVAKDLGKHLTEETFQLLNASLLAGIEIGDDSNEYIIRQATPPFADVATAPAPALGVPLSAVLSLLQTFGIAIGNTSAIATSANNTQTTTTANTTTTAGIEVPGGIPMTFGQAQTGCIAFCQSENIITVNVTYVYKSNNNNSATVGDITDSQNHVLSNSSNVANSNNNNGRRQNSFGVADTVLGNITRDSPGGGAGGRTIGDIVNLKPTKGVNTYNVSREVNIEYVSPAEPSGVPGGGDAPTPDPVVSTSDGSGTGVLTAAATNSLGGDVDI